MAVFSLIGLAVVLCLIALLSLKPWEPNESIPRLESPSAELGVGDSVALPAVAPAVAVVEAAVAPGRAELVSRPKAPVNEGEGKEADLSVGPAHVVAVAAGEAAPGPAPQPIPASPAPESSPTPAPAPDLASVPTPPSAAPEVNVPGGPVSAGGPGFEGEEGEEACAGDKYVLTITPLGEDDGTVTILLEHVVADGSIETLELEGDLDDAQSLVLQLSSEGGCVEVQADEGDGPGVPAEAAAAR